ncbi:3-hydroxyacyl-ACP dehydratase FabZ family protein [Kitasatospora sp. NPDC094028]
MPGAVSPVRGRPEPVAEGSGTAAVLVAADEPVFPGHYPGFPIFPGVCVVEHVHHTALATLPKPGLRLAAIESTRFLSPVFPGDRLEVEVAWQEKDGAWRCRAVAGTARGQAAAVRLRFTEEGAL